MTEPPAGSTVEELPWGFSHRSRLVTAPDGAQSVIKTLSGPRAATEVRRAVAIGPRLVAAGIPTPGVLAADPDADPAVLVTTYIAGSVGADWLDTPDRAAVLARTMGRVARDLARVDASALDDDGPWSDPERLADAAGGWLALLDGTSGAASLDGATLAAVGRAIAAIPAIHAGTAVRFAHGDFAPVNVLLDADGGLTAVLDLGSWRIAHPWFDAAWWGWVVRFHHPAAWDATWEMFLDAAGVPAGDAEQATIRTVQLLQVLELADETTADAPQREVWLERLAVIAGWD